MKCKAEHTFLLQCHAGLEFQHVSRNTFSLAKKVSKNKKEEGEETVEVGKKLERFQIVLRWRKSLGKGFCIIQEGRRL
jgi:phosphotransferase system IIA component